MLGIEWLRPAAFLGSILFALIGVIVFWLCFIIIDKITPFDLWREIVEKQNVALGLVVAAMSLGISLIPVAEGEAAAKPAKGKKADKAVADEDGVIG